MEGIHCASCIRAIETALVAEPDVSDARVNMSTSRLSVQWRGSPERAAELAALVTALGYRTTPFEAETVQDAQKNEQEAFLLRCMAVSGFAMGNIMLISVALWSSDQQVMGMATRDVFHWLSALIALPAIAWAGRPFFRSAWGVLKEGRTNMDVPISLALLLACGMSLSETLRHGEHAYFDSAVMLLFFLLIGRWLDARARGRARQSATQLLSMLGGYASVLENGKARKLPIRDLREGMVVQVAAGEKIPADSRVIQGVSEIDTSLVTGETIPRAVKEGGHVYSGTLNLNAPLTLRVEKPSEDSLLAQIVRLMEQAEQGRAHYVRLADRAARLYTPVVHALAALTFLGWWLAMSADWQVALLHAVTVLIITCPCALGLAVPVVQVLASGWLMRRGILLKSGDALERLEAADTVIFDKTGTLTLGTPRLKAGGHTVQELQLAASLASHSRHPLAQALAAAWNGEILTLSEVQEIPGMGVEAMHEGAVIRLGRRSWCGDAAAPGDTLQELWLNVQGQPLRFTFTDPVRQDATEVVAGLKAQGYAIHLLSGDRVEVAQAVAAELGIPHVQAGLLPADKCQVIETLRAQGRTVLMVGDGLNDAPALAAADVSMSPATGIDMAQNAADLVFRGDLLRPVAESLAIAKYSTRLVKQNFALAVGYNLLAIPLAVLGYVTPLLAAIAMSSSSLLVIGNSFRINQLGKR